jgi:ABC-type nitrate/sulfonate/bicarbonate transport system ATPase subunit
MTATAAISLRRLSKTYPATDRSEALTALRDVDLEIAPGEVLAVVGGSGCGKSTLLKIIAGLDRQHEGTVEVAGVPVTGRTARGVTFQVRSRIASLTWAVRAMTFLTSV